jgi:hypothetical protein
MLLQQKPLILTSLMSISSISMSMSGKLPNFLSSIMLSIARDKTQNFHQFLQCNCTLLFQNKHSLFSGLSQFYTLAKYTLWGPIFFATDFLLCTFGMAKINKFSGYSSVAKGFDTWYTGWALNGRILARILAEKSPKLKENTRNLN